MISFIDQAKEVLTAEKASRLEMLNMKSHNFDTSTEEDEELFAIKKEVKQLIATRDRQKNLGFLKDGGYALEDILEVMGTSKQQLVKESGMTLSQILAVLGGDKKKVMKAVNEAFPKSVAEAAAEASKPFVGVLATYGSEDLDMDVRNKKVAALVAEGGEEGLIKALTDNAKEWIVKSYISDKGPFKGKPIYPNINVVATKFKFNKDILKQELGIIPKPAPVVEEEKPAVKAKKTTKHEAEATA